MNRLALLSCLCTGLALASAPKGDDDGWEVKPKGAKVALRGEPTSTGAAFADDSPAEIWKASCAMCHGKDGSARTWLGKRNKVRDLTDPAWKAKANAQEIREAIQLGVADSKMKAFDGKMSKAQLEQLTAFVQKLGDTEVARR
jgi:cytochrome c6